MSDESETWTPSTSELAELRHDAKNVLLELDRAQMADVAKHIYSATILAASQPHLRLKRWTSWPMPNPPVPRNETSPGTAIQHALTDAYQREVAQRLYKDDLQPSIDPAPEPSEPEMLHLVSTLNSLLSHSSGKSTTTWREVPVSGKAKDRLERLFDEKTLKQYSEP